MFDSDVNTDRFESVSTVGSRSVEYGTVVFGVSIRVLSRSLVRLPRPLRYMGFGLLRGGLTLVLFSVI